MFENQTERDAAVLNADDPLVTQYAPARPAAFTGSAAPSASPAALSCTTVRSYSGRDGEDVRCSARATSACAASTTSRTSWRPLPPHFCWASSRRRSPPACAAFPGSSTASNLSPKSAACSFFNDSKATNVDATAESHRRFSRRPARDSGRQGQGQRLRSARRAAAPARPRRFS